jgi:hypothetical protein
LKRGIPESEHSIPQMMFSLDKSSFCIIPVPSSLRIVTGSVWLYNYIDQ